MAEPDIHLDVAGEARLHRALRRCWHPVARSAELGEKPMNRPPSPATQPGARSALGLSLDDALEREVREPAHLAGGLERGGLHDVEAELVIGQEVRADVVNRWDGGGTEARRGIVELARARSRLLGLDHEYRHGSDIRHGRARPKVWGATQVARECA